MRALIAAASVSLLLAGCGSAASKRPPGPTRFVAEVKAVCRRADEKARALAPGWKLKPESIGAVATLLERTERELTQVRPPARLAAGYRRLLALAGAEIKTFRAIATAMDDHDLGTARKLTGKLNGAESNRAARAMGLTVCAREAG